MGTPLGNVSRNMGWLALPPYENEGGPETPPGKHQGIKAALPFRTRWVTEGDAGGPTRERTEE